MIILIVFAFLAGIVTILSPCILPVLPIVLSGSLGGKSRPMGIVTGFIASFTFFTLFLSVIVQATGISPDVLRSVSIVLIFSFGLALLIPAIQLFFETLFTKFASFAPKSNRGGFLGGLLIGLSLGLLWTPCVGPILAAVISLALTGSVTGTAVIITASYALGTAIPMFAIMIGGQRLLRRVPWLTKNTASIQKIFGLIMIVTSVLIFLNIDRQFQSYILNVFPQYGTGLTKIEDNEAVQQRIRQINEPDTEDIGKPINQLIEKDLGTAAEIAAGGEWFNSKPLTLAELRGKVVLVDFWTYTCINCIRTLPYIKSWHEKYADRGLVIIGVHAPEFEFEKNPENVRKAIADFGLKYPIVQDNEFATWRAYDNHYWPAKYFIDKNGKIRKTHFGEGEYDESEQFIQELLAESGVDVSNMPVANPTYTVSAQTPEIYLGYGRLEHFSSNERIVPNTPTKYTAADEIPDDTIAYRGVWTVGEEYAMAAKNSVLLSAFDAQSVYLVMRPGSKSARMRVYLDGTLVDASVSGEDVIDSVVTVDADRLYKLIKLGKPGKHILKLEFLDTGIEVFAFTFG